jgi:CheY-like chemotaxis protein
MDSEPLPVEGRPQRYVVACHACHRPYDASSAEWCACITSLRSPVCPECGACACAAPKLYRDGLWSSAPQDLCQRRFAERAEPFEPVAVDPDSLKRPLVLVADDEPVILRLALKVIERLGYGVVAARDGQEAYRMAVDCRPDVLLLDALMPKMDGREVGRRLKENPATSGVKVIVMTSTFTATKYKSEALTAFRADEYITKPVDFKVLEALLKKLT